jgi:hypothetical protein
LYHDVICQILLIILLSTLLRLFLLLLKKLSFISEGEGETGKTGQVLNLQKRKEIEQSAWGLTLFHRLIPGLSEFWPKVPDIHTPHPWQHQAPCVEQCSQENIGYVSPLA